MEFRSCALEGLVMNPHFWKNKNILITGHTGFKGSWLSIWLKTLGANITGYSLPPPTNPSLFELAKVFENMNSIEGDVRNLDDVMAAFKKNSPEILIHMAAQPLVVKSYEDPYNTYTTNMLGTLNILEAVRHSESIKTVIIVTSDKCYQNKEWIWGYREHDNLGGIDPYSNSKACAELIASAYRSSFFQKSDPSSKNISVATVRAGNVVGGGDWAEYRLIPDIMSSIITDNLITIRNPESIRPWQFVLEPLDGYLTLAEQLYSNQNNYADSNGNEYAASWNFGPNESDAQTVGWIVKKLRALWGSEVNWKVLPKSHPYESKYLKLDCSKALQKLQWKPKLNLNTTLEWVIEWYRGYCNNINLKELTEKQIKKYQNLNNS